MIYVSSGTLQFYCRCCFGSIFDHVRSLLVNNAIAFFKLLIKPKTQTTHHEHGRMIQTAIWNSNTGAHVYQNESY